MVDVLSAIKTSLSITDQLLKTTHSCVVTIVTQHRKDAALKSKLTHFEMHLVAMNQVLHAVKDRHRSVSDNEPFASVLLDLEGTMAKVQVIVGDMLTKLQAGGPSKRKRLWNIFIGKSMEESQLDDAIAALGGVLKATGDLVDLEKNLGEEAANTPFPQQFEEWEYYQPPPTAQDSCLKYLHDSSATDRVVVVTGMFGMGKSSLARHMACIFNGQDQAFPDGVLWLQCGESCNIQEKREMLLEELRQMQGHRGNQHARISWQAAGASRNRDIWGTAAVVELSEAENNQIAKPLLVSLAFADEIVSVPSEYEEVVEKVLEECNGCPLAIAIVAHSLRKYNGVGGWRRFLDVWSKSTLLYKNTKNPASDGRHESLYAAIQLSLDAPPDAAKGVNALEAACLFPAGFKIPIDSVFGAACAAMHPASAEAPTAVILLLRQHNLITVQRNLEFVQVHRLVANYMWDHRTRQKEMVAALIALLQPGSVAEAKSLATGGLINRTSRSGYGDITMESGGIPALIEIMRPGNPWEAVGSAAGALGNLAHGDPACREEVSRCQGIEELVRVVRTAPGSVRDCAAMALANLVAGSQGRIAACGGIEALLDLLVPGRSVELNKPVHEILTVLAKSSPDYEAQIRAGGGMEKVIAQLTPPYEFTSTHPSYTLTLAALCSAGNTLLAVAGGSADTIMDHGDVAKLIALVQPDSPAPVRPVAICALGFLASASKAYQDSIRESKGIDRLVAVLGWGDAQELQLAARALAGMAADNEQNQNAIRHAHGIQALIGVLGNRPAASAAAAALAAIAAGNEENRLAWGNAMGSKRC